MSIALSIGNNLTTGGVFTSSAVNNTSVTNVTDFASVPGAGGLKLLSTQTASNSSEISFTSNIDSTYDSYIFKLINVHTDTDNTYVTFNFSTDGGSNYNVTKTSTFFMARHNEADTESAVDYQTNRDLAQSTGDQQIDVDTGNGSDESVNGTLQLYNPSSTTFVKHFIGRFSVYTYHDYARDNYLAGYGNTTSAINAIRFKPSSGTFDGIIKMYGVV